ncbi:hypothetical protein [Streptomyces pseudogriseolus]
MVLLVNDNSARLMVSMPVPNEKPSVHIKLTWIYVRDFAEQ